jgi:hypothetical protein
MRIYKTALNEEIGYTFQHVVSLLLYLFSPSIIPESSLLTHCEFISKLRLASLIRLHHCLNPL